MKNPMPASRRDILIAEMGLGPVWRLRDRAAEAAAQSVAAAPEKQALPEPRTGAPARPQPVGPAGRNIAPAMATMRASVVSPALVVDAISSAPSPLMVPANTVAPLTFWTGTLSPVIGA